MFAFNYFITIVFAYRVERPSGDIYPVVSPIRNLTYPNSFYYANNLYYDYRLIHFFY